MIFNVNESNMFDSRDLLIDIYLEFESWKSTSRYKQVEQTLNNDI
jgi:hypothetical protein